MKKRETKSINACIIRLHVEDAQGYRRMLEMAHIIINNKETLLQAIFMRKMKIINNFEIPSCSMEAFPF